MGPREAAKRGKTAILNALGGCATVFDAPCASETEFAHPTKQTDKKNRGRRSVFPKAPSKPVAPELPQTPSTEASLASRQFRKPPWSTD